jgi:hypothetical protein
MLLWSRSPVGWVMLACGLPNMHATYIAYADIFHQRWIHVHPLHHLFQQLDHYGVERCVLEAAFPGLA